MAEKRVHINSATEADLCKLKGIGTVRAHDIINYREQVGYLHGPYDLAHVKGIDVGRAVRLSPFIDWSIPASEPQKSNSKPRDWLSASLWFLLACLLGVGALFVVFMAIVSARRSQITTFQYSILAVALLSLILLGLFVGLQAAKALTTNLVRSRVLSRWATLALACSVIVGILFVFLNVIYSGLRQQSNLSDSSGNNGLLLQAAILFGLLGILSIPQVLVLLRPELSQNILLARLFDLGLGIAGLTAGVITWFILGKIGRNSWPVGLFLVIVGVVVIFLFAIVVRRGESFFPATLGFLDQNVLNERKRRRQEIKDWLALVLPNQTDRQLAWIILSETFREPLFRQIGGGRLLFLIVSWSLGTFFSAVAEWFIQGFLEQVLGSI